MKKGLYLGVALLLSCSNWGVALAADKTEAIATDGSNTVESPYFKLQYPVNAQPNDPHVELHMDERYMYGLGSFDTNLTPKEKMYYSTLRTRMWFQGTVNEQLKVTALLKDERSVRHGGADDTAHFERVYANYKQGDFSSTAGRFYYWIDDGNVFEDVMDGARLQVGDSQTNAAVTLGRMKDAYNTTGTKGSMQGYILRGRHRVAAVEEELAYYNFKKHGDYATEFNKQRILSARTRYYLSPAVSVGWEYLKARGSRTSGMNNNDHGMVWSVNLGDEWSNPSVKNSYCVHLRHYDQPRSSFIKHTMSGFPNLFSDMGFKGWGLYSEYVVVPGIQVTLEAYDLKNKDSLGYFTGAKEKVIGASVSFYF